MVHLIEWASIMPVPVLADGGHIIRYPHPLQATNCLIRRYPGVSSLLPVSVCYSTMNLLELLQLKPPSSLLTTVVNWIEGPLNNSIKGPRQRMPVNFPSTCIVWKYRKYLKPRLFTVPSLGLQTMCLDWWICCTSEEALFLSSSPRGSATVTQRFDRWVYVGHEGSITSSEHKTFWQATCFIVHRGRSPYTRRADGRRSRVWS